MSSERTEDPTPRRIKEAREEGNIAYSREVNAAAALLIGAWMLQILGQRMMTDMQSLMRSSIASLSRLNTPSIEVGGAWLRDLTTAALRQVGPTVMLFVGSLLLVGVVASVLQTGLLFAKKKLGFDFKRVNPAQGLKRLFSMQGLAELVKSILKLVVIGWTAYGFLRSHQGELMSMSLMDFRSALVLWGGLAVRLSTRVAGVYLVLAAADYAYQRWQYKKSLKMTKEEVKEEMRQREGDPHVRGRIRRERMKLAQSRMMAQVPEADVVITNPTHLAIAVKYSPEVMGAPVVLAKGADKLAERIIETARDHRIVIKQDIPLAHAIYNSVEVNQEIPPELYLAVAELLAYVYRLEGRQN
jgi:flagellar biosynthetic protein FlhB